MKTEISTPTLDGEELQKKVNEFAMKGAVKSIKEYYSGYNSPFRKSIDEQLKQQQIGGLVELPDIIGVINKALSKEIDQIANTAVAKTFVPLVSRFLVREEKEVAFSYILKEFINLTNQDDYYDCECNINRNDKYEWLDVEISGKENNSFRLTLHLDYQSNKEGKKKYKLLTLPHSATSGEKMKVSLDGATLELPFVSDILHNEFTSLIARLCISESLITMDCEEFEENMFDKHCSCD